MWIKKITFQTYRNCVSCVKKINARINIFYIEDDKNNTALFLFTNNNN